MSEYTEASKLLLGFLKERPFLFRKGMDDFTIAEYLKWFEERNDSDFFAYPAMMTYDAKMIDLYSKKVVNSMFVPLTSGLLALHTIVQLSPTCHLIFVYSNSSDRRKVITYCTIYSTDPSDFFKFTEDADAYFFEDERHAGFQAGFKGFAQS